MILYHFTCPWRFWGEDWKSRCDPETGILKIEQPDLLPSNKQWNEDVLPQRLREPVVWLTTSTETKPTEDPRGLNLRLTVSLLSTDRKLRSYAKWVGPELLAGIPQDHSKKVRAEWWVYRGVIPARQIRDAKLIMGQRPWWEQSDES
jgi:hypothetical protein